MSVFDSTIPTGPLADDAVMATANAHFLKAHWEEADYNYGLLRSEYPKSEHQFQAHLLGLRCKLLRYQGPGYEGGPLDEAEDLATQLLTQFSARPRRREARRCCRCVPAFAIRERCATWIWPSTMPRASTMAHRGFTTQRYRRNIPTRNWPRNLAAGWSSSRSEPDNPTPPFEWLVNLMPQSTREGPVLPKNMATVATNPSSSTRPLRTTREKPHVYRFQPQSARHRRHPPRASDDAGAVDVGIGAGPISRRQATLAICSALATLGTLGLGGCAGYRFGAASLYPPDIQTVYVPVFESNSFRRNLSEWLTEVVCKEIELKTPYKVVGTPQADSVLTGKLISDTKRVIIEDKFDYAARSRGQHGRRGTVGQPPRRFD